MKLNSQQALGVVPVIRKHKALAKQASAHQHDARLGDIPYKAVAAETAEAQANESHSHKRSAASHGSADPDPDPVNDESVSLACQQQQHRSACSVMQSSKCCRHF